MLPHQPQQACPIDGVVARYGREFGEQVLEVPFDGFAADIERPRDPFVGKTLLRGPPRRVSRRPAHQTPSSSPAQRALFLAEGGEPLSKSGLDTA